MEQHSLNKEIEHDKRYSRAVTGDHRRFQLLRRTRETGVFARIIGAIAPLPDHLQAKSDKMEQVHECMTPVLSRQKSKTARCNFILTYRLSHRRTRLRHDHDERCQRCNTRAGAGYSQRFLFANRVATRAFCPAYGGHEYVLLYMKRLTTATLDRISAFPKNQS